MITNEAGWLAARGFPGRFDDVMNNRRLGRALVALLRLADYARRFDRNEREMSARVALLMRERREWQQLFERSTERADKAGVLLRELAEGDPDSARVVALEVALTRVDAKLTEMTNFRGVWRERCRALESKLKVVEESRS